MLYTIAVILIVLWALGLVTGATIGGLIHILLVIAIVLIVINLISTSKLAVKPKKPSRGIEGPKTWNLK